MNNNTTDKTEESRFQEERRDVMKMDKLFAGLIAFAAGVALSAGSAFAQTNGYTIGDTARMKLIPYYETGDMTATIIGIQNMSPQQQDTKDKNQDVADLEAYLGGAVPDDTMRDNLNAAPISLDPNAVSGTALSETDLNAVSGVEKALEAANKAKYVENLFVGVKVYDATGMMMENASASLCLAENQFGVVVLQGATAMMAEGNQMQVLSVADEDIPENGYVEIIAEDQKYSSCDFSSRTNPPALVNTAADPSSTTTTAGADSKLATWAIIQDTGVGFFGTEVGSATISTAKNTSADAKPEVACYTTPAADAGTATTAPFTGGAFDMKRCGLVPERNNMGALNNASTTDNATIHARYDAGDDSMVYVWLAAGGDTEKTKPSKRRMLDVKVICEDGSMKSKPDADGNPNKGPIEVAAPGMVTMIDPVGDALGEYTDMCEGDRGVLEITMPNNSRAGMAFTHVTQMMGHYRMNFPGYSMASTDACTTTSSEVCK